MTTTTTHLTDYDRYVLAKARELAAGDDGTAEALRAHLTPAGIIKPADPDEMLYPIAYGNAKWLLGELAALAGRLGGDGA